MVFTRRRWLALTGAVVFGLAQSLAVDPAKAQSSDVVVFAAASLKNALDEINAAWTKETGKKAVISYASSPALAKQIEQSAPADLFISADLDWMDYVAERKLIRAETRGNLLGNRLVLVGSKGSAPLAVKAAFDLSGALKGGKLAVANVDSVPAGKYGKAAMEKLGVWESVKDKLAQSENVRAALLLVSRGEAPLGIVYKTDAAADPNVSIVGELPEETHPPIVYPAAITASSTHGDASAFLAFMRSPAAKALFEKQGFTVLPADRPRS
jgi:molybdate transport system substrate-binding protein